MFFWTYENEGKKICYNNIEKIILIIGDEKFCGKVVKELKLTVREFNYRVWKLIELNTVTLVKLSPGSTQMFCLDFHEKFESLFSLYKNRYVYLLVYFQPIVLTKYLLFVARCNDLNKKKIILKNILTVWYLIRW